MVDRIEWFINRPYGVDNYARLRYGESGQNALIPCEPVQDRSLCLGIVGNSKLKIDKLMITDTDRKPIKVTSEATSETVLLTYPGKSAFVIFEPNACDKSFVKETVTYLLNSTADRRDRIHVATVAEVEEAGWTVFYAPLQLKPIYNHMRIVSKRTIATGEDPTVNDIEKLKSVFTLIPNLHG